MKPSYEQIPTSPAGSERSGSPRSMDFPERSTQVSAAMIHVLRRVMKPFRSMLSVLSAGKPSSDSVKPSSLFDYIKSFIFFLLPSVFFAATRNKLVASGKNPTAWVDGMRGLAAFIVFQHHFILPYTPWHHYAYSVPDDMRIEQWPFVRLLTAGEPMVSLFFVISGFALAYKSVKLLRKPQYPYQQMLQSLGSSVARRYFRLILPCAAVFLYVHLFMHFGGFDWYEDLKKERNGDPFPQGTFPMMTVKVNGTVYDQLRFAADEFWIFAVKGVALGVPIGIIRTNITLWTMPTEYRESLILFLFIIATASFKRTVRVFVLIPATTAFFLMNRQWTTALFLWGYFVAEMHETHEEWKRSQPDSSADLPILNEKMSLYQQAGNQSTLNRWFLPWIRRAAMLLALHVLSYPVINGERSPPFRWFFKHSPIIYEHDFHRYWQSLASGAILLLSIYMKHVREFFSSPILQYLGKISFALYIVHDTLHSVYSNRMVIWMGWKDPFKDQRIVYKTYFLFVWPVCVWVADVFERAVDANAVRLVRWMESKLTM